MRRREFITLVGGATAVWPLMARGQQPAMPVVGFLNAGSAEGFTSAAAAFRNALGDAGYVEGQNVTIDYHWLEGGYDRMPGLVADLVRHHVAVIVTPTTQAALAAKAATTTIPIVFGVAEDPVKLGLVASFARPGGNATGVNFFFNEVVPKRLELLHDLVPNAVRLAVLLNPANAPVTEAMLRNLPEAARALGFQVQVLHATTNSEIDAAFATIARDRADAALHDVRSTPKADIRFQPNICRDGSKADIGVECALGAGQVEASELTVGAGLSKDESHGPTTFPQHRVQTTGCTGVHCRRDPVRAFQAA